MKPEPKPSKNLMFSLDGKVAIITGAAGLLGEQHALALGLAGAKIVLADIREEECQKRAEALAREHGLDCLALSCNITESASWNEALERVLEKYGQVDVLVNNAAYTNQSRSSNFGAAFLDFPLADWNAIMEVNLTGTFLGCQTVGRQMIRQKSGSIINIASLYGVVSPHHRMYPGTGIQQPVAYSVSKTGVIALTRYLATLWAEQGVRVNCLTPGGVFNNHSDLFSTRFAALCPIGRMAKPDEMQGALVYLASAASSYCTGHNLIVDGGWTAW